MWVLRFCECCFLQHNGFVLCGHELSVMDDDMASARAAWRTVAARLDLDGSSPMPVHPP